MLFFWPTGAFLPNFLALCISNGGFGVNAQDQFVPEFYGLLQDERCVNNSLTAPDLATCLTIVLKRQIIKFTIGGKEIIFQIARFAVDANDIQIIRFCIVKHIKNQGFGATAVKGSE